MALIELYHVVADFYPVDPDWSTAIVEGMVVDLSATGFVAGATGAAAERAIGLAADTLASTPPTAAAHPHTPYSAAVTINAAGSTQWTQNRVSDAFNETLASGQMTVYHSGGKFASTEYEVLTGAVPITYAVGNPLYVSANSRLTNVASTSAQVIGTVVVAPSAYPSGVPGTAVTGSTSLGTYIQFKLEI